MTRLRQLRTEELDDDALALYEHVCATRLGARVGTEGLLGPFNAYVYAPKIGTHLLDLGLVFHSQTSLAPRAIELVILTVAAHWKAEFVWWSHTRRARWEHGVAEHIIDAIAAGRTPELDNDDEATLLDVARQVVAKGAVDDAHYERAAEILGDRGLVELISLIGKYTLVCFLVNGFDAELPAGEAMRWANPPTTMPTYGQP